MYTNTYFPREAERAKAYSRRSTGAGLVLLCLALTGYSATGVFKDVWLVDRAFPSLPSYFATDVDVSILVSPIATGLHVLGADFLRWIKYPPLTFPNAPLPTGDPVNDEIVKAQREQGLLRPGGAVPLERIMDLHQQSLETLGRAIYLSQGSNEAALAFAQGRERSAATFAQESSVQQVRQLFAIAYGQNALRQVTLPD